MQHLRNSAVIGFKVSCVILIMCGGILVDISLKVAPTDWHRAAAEWLKLSFRYAAIAATVCGVLVLLLNVTQRGKSTKRATAAPLGPDLRATLLQMVIKETETRDRQDAARSDGQPCVFLRPDFSTGSVKHSGWFGGAPRLPQSVEWPSYQGEPLRFVCQISLSDLPQNIWSGCGPRHGWMVVFMAKQEMHPVVLHVDGPLEDRAGPGQSDTEWFYPRTYSEKPLKDHLPKLPIQMIGHTGVLPDYCLKRTGHAAGLPDPRTAEFFDLSDPQFHPLDRGMLRFLLQSIAVDLSSRARALDGFMAKKLRPSDQALLKAAQDTIAGTQAQFDEIRTSLAPYEARFDGAAIRSFMAQLATLRVSAFNYLKNDEDGTAVIEFHDVGLCDVAPGTYVHWRHDYLNRLYRQGLHTFADGHALPQPQRDRLTEIWSIEAMYEGGMMGHAPAGHVYTPYGPGTANEVLLELKSSELPGWIWGDLYSVVFFIDRNALKAGDFTAVTVEITN